MPYRKFVFFNILGAFLWGVGLTFLGWAVAHIPGVAELVTQYIDVVLISVISIALIGIAYHLISERVKMRAEQRREDAGLPALQTSDER